MAQVLPAERQPRRGSRRVAAWLAGVGGLVGLLIWSAPDRRGEDKAPIRVLAAASLTDAVSELAARYEAAHPGVDVVPVFSASSTAARQIEMGAEADVFLSADTAWMDYLEEHGLVQAGSRREPLSNVLVVVTSDANLSLGNVNDLASLGRIAIAEPDSVPAGRYAREALLRAGLWGEVSQRWVVAPDVRAALTYAERGEVDAAIVYGSDAAITDAVRVALRLPPALQPDIRYAFAALRDAPAPDRARALLDFLTSPEAGGVFVRSGFVWSSASGESAEGAALAFGAAGESDWEILRLSLFIAVVAVLLCLPAGLLCGWLLARVQFRGKSVVENLVYLPLVLPPAVTGFLLLVLLGRSGPVGGPLFDLFGIQIAFSWLAAALAAAAVAIPLLVQSVRSAIEAVDPGLEEAARTLGAGGWRVARTVTLPLAAPGIIAGVVVCFARALGELGATLVFAGNTPGVTQTIPLAVWTRVSQIGGDEAAVRLVVISVIVSYVSLFVAARLHQRTLRRARGQES